ncbi:hypothetical protein G5B40_04795 [Pikeienuella piscinae]|uniref:Uncharacterized protein n=1 Tax=Pikeienuella piscinae TaxID=2748098 RepID=A0A7L5BUB6_9RHOB|nr:hypothetical protein [Pikeienuella piscinae]QIE54821.1 hypothetical protein G5B40_04795 [Pikeienuella piscinae]
MRKNEGPTGDLDPHALILEAYRIEGIGAADCRTIFFDWAIGAMADRDIVADAAALLAHYHDKAPDHPMTAVLREGALTPPPRRRKRARRRGQGALRLRGSG